MFIQNRFDIVREREDGTGSGEAAPASSETSGEEAAPTSSSMFDPSAGGDTSGDAPPAEQESGERPEWLLPKYETPEDQAKAYRELYGRFSKKTDDLKAEIKGEFEQQWLEERGVPEEVDGYQAPEDIKFEIGEDFDTNLRTWAKENGVGNEAYQSLLKMYDAAMPDFDSEKAKLGDNADQRVSNLNNWLNRNVGEEHHKILNAVMSTADGVQLIESLAGMTAERSFAPESGEASPKRPMTRGEIREAQADPRFGNDPDYTDYVRNLWAEFAVRNPG